MVTLFQTLHTLSYITADRVTARMQALKNDEKGASAVEYAILVGIIAAALIIVVGTFGTRLKTAFNSIVFS